MADLWTQGKWLLIDAAGPEIVAGLLGDGGWLACARSEGDALASIEPAVARLLAERECPLESLAGCLYASGPGSTLGLRLAAMFLRGLMQLPELRHWRCLCYHNLELACAGMAANSPAESTRLAAPWRRDRLHLVRMIPGPPAAFERGSVAPDSVVEKSIPIVRLGRRLPDMEDKAAMLPYPVERIPEILGAFPELLSPCREPALYTAEDPAFAKWSPVRHGAP